MKILKIILSIILIISITGCANRKTIKSSENGVSVTRTYIPYGLFDPEDQNPNIQYRVSIGNVVWSILLFETVIAPVVLFGWYLYEPVGPKVPNDMRGVVNE